MKTTWKKIDELIDDDTYPMVEAILDKYGASEDDSDPDEGYYVTMSLEDLKSAYSEISKRLYDSTINSLSLGSRGQYKMLINRKKLTDYEAGWLAGYEAHMLQ